MLYSIEIERHFITPNLTFRSNVDFNKTSKPKGQLKNPKILIVIENNIQVLMVKHSLNFDYYTSIKACESWPRVHGKGFNALISIEL